MRLTVTWNSVWEREDRAFIRLAATTLLRAPISMRARTSWTSSEETFEEVTVAREGR